MEGMGVENLRRQGRFSGVLTTTRLFADRRHGVDRRAERRSTLERRGRPQRDPSPEGPGEHLRNALQLLGQVPFAGEPVFSAAVARLRRALDLLENRH
jgi:hypothetical protein